MISEKTREEVALFLKGRRPFKRASLSAQRYGRLNRGKLPEAEWLTLQSQEPAYVVYSYETPIAWIDPEGVAIIPDIKYSHTTTIHQELVRKYL